VVIFKILNHVNLQRLAETCCCRNQNLIEKIYFLESAHYLDSQLDKIEFLILYINKFLTHKIVLLAPHEFFCFTKVHLQICIMIKVFILGDFSYVVFLVATIFWLTHQNIYGLIQSLSHPRTSQIANTSKGVRNCFFLNFPFTTFTLTSIWRIQCSPTMYIHILKSQSYSRSQKWLTPHAHPTQSNGNLNHLY
jgi:hypothetical protein